MRIPAFLTLCATSGVLVFGSVAFANRPSQWQYNTNNGRVSVYQNITHCNAHLSQGCSSEEWCNITRYTSAANRTKMIEEYNNYGTVIIYNQGTNTEVCREKR